MTFPLMEFKGRSDSSVSTMLKRHIEQNSETIQDINTEAVKSCSLLASAISKKSKSNQIR